MDLGIISCIPILVLIVGAFTTKRMTETLLVSTLVGSVIIYKQHFFGGFVELIYMVLSNDSFQFILILLMGIGGLIRLFERSGALAAFREKLEKAVRGPKSALFATWLFTIVMCIDDYLSLLTVGSTMKKLTDRQGVPREHLAYTLNAMGVSMCLLIPYTSWSVFTVTSLEPEGMDFSDYLHAIPFMFFPMACVVISLLFALGVLPCIGGMKEAYARGNAGGPTLPKAADNGAAIVEAEKEEDSQVKPSSVLNFFIPMIVLIVVMILYDRSIVHGIVAALFCILILYKAEGIMTVGQVFTNLFAGMKSMVAVAFVILFAFMIATENEIMGFAPFVVESLSKQISPELLPLFIFVIMALVSFTMGDVWSLILISLPIFIPMAQHMGTNTAIALGALLSGANFGVVMCLQSDALFMTYAGTGVPNLTQIKTGLAYMVTAGIIAAAGYPVVGLI